MSSIYILLALFFLLLGILILGMVTLSYVQRVHAWHNTCRRIETSRDEKVQIMVGNEEELAAALRSNMERQHQIALLLVSLTNEVLSLSQASKSVAPPPRETSHVD
jgi:hypothetical protein